MPLASAHVFASHIGHTGKTTLCFQMACHYASQHPDESVLVADLAEEGDCTKRLLGGVDAASRKVDEIFGSIFKLISDAQSKRSSGITGWLWDRGDLDISKHAIAVHEHNPLVPNNLFLISSGAWSDERSEEAMADDARRSICARILQGLRNSETTWKLFCDTDGDRRPSPFTLLGYGLCSQAIVPLHLNKADLDRTETMLYVLNDLRERGVVDTKVLCVVWNMVKVLKDEPCENEGSHLSFTPTKISLDILRACNRRLLATAKELPDLFVHEVDDAGFVNRSTVMLRQLADNVLKPSEELGQPFVQMSSQLKESGKKTLKFQSGDIVYETKSTVVEAVDEALGELSRKFNLMSLGSPTVPEA